MGKVRKRSKGLTHCEHTEVSLGEEFAAVSEILEPHVLGCALELEREE